LIAPALVVAASSFGTAIQNNAVSAVVAPIPQADIGEPSRIHVAQSREEAQLALQIQQLQEQIRLLTGQVEGLQFQLTQMQTLIERMTEDNEFRFQQLEGGAGGKPDAATQSGGVPRRLCPIRRPSIRPPRPIWVQASRWKISASRPTRWSGPAGPATTRWAPSMT
jgi:TolA-binding protein